jgi:hypothetical protein
MRSVTFRWFYGRGWNEVVQDTRDSDTIGNSGIEFEGEFWGVAQCQVFAKLATNKTSGTLKALDSRLLLGFTPYPADIHTSMTQIRRYFDARDRRHAQTWVLQLT